jgi:hypothetical protein
MRTGRQEAAEMTDTSNQDSKKRESLILARQLAAIAAGIALVILVITTFLSFLSEECQRGAPFMPEMFVCFPAE